MQTPGQDVMVDLGSGAGKPVFAAAALYPFKSVVGIEVRLWKWRDRQAGNEAFAQQYDLLTQFDKFNPSILFTRCIQILESLHGAGLEILGRWDTEARPLLTALHGGIDTGGSGGD